MGHSFLNRRVLLYDGNGNAITSTAFGSNQALDTNLSPVVDTPEFFEDTSFTSGESPVTLDINTALGRNATDVVIINDGAGDFDVSLSTDGAAFGDDITMKDGEVLEFGAVDVDSVRITHSGTNSAYRVIAI